MRILKYSSGDYYLVAYPSYCILVYLHNPQLPNLPLPAPLSLDGRDLVLVICRSTSLFRICVALEIPHVVMPC